MKDEEGRRIWTDISVYGWERFHASASSPNEMPYGADREQRIIFTDAELEAHEREVWEAAREHLLDGDGFTFKDWKARQKEQKNEKTK